jgi:hypothetical protein
MAKPKRPPRPPKPKKIPGINDDYEWWPDPKGGVDPETGFLKGQWVLE